MKRIGVFGELTVEHARFLWGVAAAFLAVYNVTKNLNIPLIVQPQIFGTLAFISWSQV